MKLFPDMFPTDVATLTRAESDGVGRPYPARLRTRSQALLAWVFAGLCGKPGQFEVHCLFPFQSFLQQLDTFAETWLGGGPGPYIPIR